MRSRKTDSPSGHQGEALGISLVERQDADNIRLIVSSYLCRHRARHRRHTRPLSSAIFCSEEKTCCVRDGDSSTFWVLKRRGCVIVIRAWHLLLPLFRVSRSYMSLITCYMNAYRPSRIRTQRPARTSLHGRSVAEEVKALNLGLWKWKC